MHTKTLTSAVGATVLAAAVTTVLSTSALAQTPGEAEGIVVSSEAFDAVKGWLGDTEENSTFKEFLVEGEGGDTLTQWLATVQGLREYISPQQFLSEQFPDRAKELEEFAADEGWNYADPRTLALHMLAADEDLFDRWEERVALKNGLGLESFAQSRALPEFTKWRGTLSIPAETTSLDEWMSARVRLELPPELPEGAAYLAVVQTADGAEVFRASGLRETAGPRGRAVDLDLPVRRLASRDYVVLLSRERGDGSPQLVRGYAFRADVIP